MVEALDSRCRVSKVRWQGKNGVEKKREKERRTKENKRGKKVPKSA
jgi:hypothetical protein